MKTEAISDLKLFNEKAALLLKSSFADAMLRNESAFMFAWKAGQSCEAVVVGAEGESVDAAFLTLRMFMQNNDRISIGNMAKIYSQEKELEAPIVSQLFLNLVNVATANLIKGIVAIAQINNALFAIKTERV